MDSSGNGAQQTQLGAGEEQQDRHSFSHLDNLMTLGFSDGSLSGFLDPAFFLTDQALDPATPTLCRERRMEKSGSSEWQGFRRADNCILVQDDPLHEVTERPRKRRNRTLQSHSLTEKRRREKIKAKLKGLQELIPNSQKLDKASLLDNVMSHIKTLQLQLQDREVFNLDPEPSIILQGMSSHPCLYAPPMQYATATQSSQFVSPIPSNMNFGTGPNANMYTNEPHLPLGIPYSLPFWPVAGNFMSMPYSLPPNPYFQPPATSTFQQPQFPEMAPHAAKFQ